MDVRAFGSYYSQSASLPYASGFFVLASGASINFPACRAFYINDGGSNHELQVVFADGPKTPITLDNVSANVIYPFSITTISGAQTTVHSVLVLY